MLLVEVCLVNSCGFDEFGCLVNCVEFGGFCWLVDGRFDWIELFVEIIGMVWILFVDVLFNILFIYNFFKIDIGKFEVVFIFIFDSFFFRVLVG